MPTALTSNLLGGFRLFRDEKLITGPNTPRLQSLFAYLVLHRDASQSRQQPAFLLGRASTESQARTNLRHLIHLASEVQACPISVLPQVGLTNLGKFYHPRENTLIRRVARAPHTGRTCRM
jgi:hypothetical protein